MNTELMEALNILEKEKDISKETLMAVSYTHLDVYKRQP